MKKFFLVVLCALAVWNVHSLDLGYSIYAGAGISMAFGGDLESLLSEFGSSVGAEAAYAPVLGTVLGFGVDMPVFGDMRVCAGLELRRLGYAFWAGDAAALSWLALWTAGVRLGLRWEPDPWYAGFGAVLDAPISGIDQATTQGGAGIVVGYGADAGKALIPGAYVEGGFTLDKHFNLGKLELRPNVGMAVGLWPLGLVDGVQTWQTALNVVLALHIERTAR